MDAMTDTQLQEATAENVYFTPIESARMQFWEHFNYELYLQYINIKNAE